MHLFLQFCDISLYRYRFQRTCTANKKHTWANLLFNIHHLWCHNFFLVCCSAKNDLLKEKRFYCGIVVAMVHLSFKIFTLRRLSTNIIFTLFCSSHLQTIYLQFCCHHTCHLSNYSLFLHTSHFLQPLIKGEASPLSCWQLKNRNSLYYHDWLKHTWHALLPAPQ